MNHVFSQSEVNNMKRFVSGLIRNVEEEFICFHIHPTLQFEGNRDEETFDDSDYEE